MIKRTAVLYTLSTIIAMMIVIFLYQYIDGFINSQEFVQDTASNLTPNNNVGDQDIARTRDTRSERDFRPSRLDILESSLEDQEDIAVSIVQEAGSAGLDPDVWAELNFSTDWAEFVAELDLPEADKRAVQDMIIGYWARNKELFDLYYAGLISQNEYESEQMSPSELEQRLSALLSPEQLESYRLYSGMISDNSTQLREQITQTYVDEDYIGILAFSNLGNLDAVLDYIESGANVNSRPSDGRTSPLHNAVFHNNLAMVEALIEAGADVNWATETDNMSPLQWAAIMGDAEIVRVLVAAGADLEYSGLEDGQVSTALAQAAEIGKIEVVEELLVLGADVTGPSGIQALRFAIMQGNSELEEILIGAGVDINAPEIIATKEATARVSL